MNWFEKYAYNQEVGFLDRYLKSPPDPYEYIHYVRDYLDDQGIDYDSGKFDEDDFNASEEWLNHASPAEKENFLEYAKEKSARFNEDPYTRPTKDQMQYRRFAKPGWLVHFTDDPWGIASDGFIYGHDDIEGLALTTLKSKKSRQSYPGFNFAFDADSRDASRALSGRRGGPKYGKHAVVFWAAGVEAYHYGDEENQIIFWGPSVKKDMIFPIESQGGDWVVNDSSGRVRKAGDFGSVVDWVENNYRLLQQTEKREYNIKQEKRRQNEKKHSDELERFDRVVAP